jgi:hypothetical protein
MEDPNYRKLEFLLKKLILPEDPSHFSWENIDY